MGTGIKYPVPRVKPSFVIFDIARIPKITNDVRLNPVWYRTLYSCTHMAAVGVKGLEDDYRGCEGGLGGD